MPTPVNVLGILAIVLAGAASSALGSTQEEVFQRTVPAADVSMLSVSNVNGAISVQPWDKPEIHIVAKKRVRHSSQETAEHYARQIEIAVETKGDVLEVRTVLPVQQEGWDWVEWFFSLDWLFERRAREASVSYEISTPRRIDTNLVSTNGGVHIGAIEGRADLHTTNGAVTAEGTQGAVKANTTNGAIRLLQVAGGCHAVTTNGKITAQLLSLGSQGCELQTTNGAIHITLPENIRADLDASTTNGNVTSALPLSLQGTISQRGMEGKINGGGPSLKLRTTIGGITLEGKINGGGPPLKLRTRNGGITIEKASAGEEVMPPAAVSPSP
jgi:hypothetical protein